MACALTPRSEVPPEEKAKLAEKRAKLDALIAFMRTMPDNPEPSDINRVAMVAQALASKDEK